MNSRQRISGAILTALLIAVLISAWGDKECTTLVCRGDFPAFYAAGSLALGGKDNLARLGGSLDGPSLLPIIEKPYPLASRALYSADLQHQIENQHWPSLKSRYYYFAYPPYVAVLLGPLALVSAWSAKLILTGLMLLALFGSVALLDELKKQAFGTLEVVLVLLCCAPVFIGVLSGQNVALSMLLYACVLRGGANENRPQGEREIGLATGLWFFKPHFSSVLLVLLFCAGRYRAIAWALIPAAVYFLIAVILIGPTWPLAWVHEVSQFADRDFIANQHQMVSFSGFFRGLAIGLGLPESQSTFALVGLVLGLCLFLLVGWQFYRTRKNPSLFHGQLCLAGPLIALMSPHTLYYELGLCLIALAASAAIPSSLVLAIVWVFFAVASLLHDILPATPLIIFAIGSFFWLYKNQTGRLSSS